MSTPDLARCFDDSSKLRVLLLDAQPVAGSRAGEAALGAQGQLVEIDVSRRFVDPSLERVFGLELGSLARDQAEHDGFVATPVGKRFENAYMHDTIAYEEAKENAVRASVPNADGFAIYRPANLNKLFDKFVAENYKK